MRSSRFWGVPVPDGSGRRVLVVTLVVIAMALAVAAVALVTSGGTGSAGAVSGDPADTLEDALAQGELVYVLVHSAT